MDITLEKDIIRLDSSKSCIPINKNFKLYAGPGAGKTTFLTEHIKRITRESKILTKNRKIVCITYTNTAVNTLNERLKSAENSLEISTIHSFCYKFIVKPFIWILKDCILPIAEINGHENIKLRQSQMKDFKTQTQQFYLDNKQLSESLEKLKWILDGDGNLILDFVKFSDGRIDNFNLKKESFLVYKEIYWKEGKLSHDDVLYFAYRILTENPSLLRVIRAQFPYILIDEFQDTSPLQTAIIKLIGEKDTIIGVIGDICQSIYSFQGSNVDSFKSFSLNNMQEYIIEGNRRSTEQIIKILNHMRNNLDFIQYSPDNKIGHKPKIIIGSKTASLKYLDETCEEIIYLSYKNPNNKYPNIILEDSTSNRGCMIYYVVQSLELGKELDIKNAIRFMKRAYRKNILFDDKAALINLKRLLNDYSMFEDISITEFYNTYLLGYYQVKNKITNGKVKDLYDSITIKQLATYINRTDKGKLEQKTIHQSKGDEFENVCIFFQEDSKEKNLEFLLSPDMTKEVHRVYYVALSRAVKKLYIHIPENIDHKTAERLKEIGFLLVYLD
ncbi:UvrD-helicase domain-containing protein [Kurthia populi]|uniref:DNA 3'-5' helicase n=1 Tax=Kurthia populi TaxID=1562132 RepID=A0ABW5Y1E9_9BACL